MNVAPTWLLRHRRIKAALKARRPLAPEDADALLAAIEAAEGAASTDDLHAIEQFLEYPTDWRSAKRQIERGEVIKFLIGEGFRGRAGAWRLHLAARRYPATTFERDRRSGRVPGGELTAVFHLMNANGGCMPTENYLAKLLI
jgi:hypothetical protein